MTRYDGVMTRRSQVASKKRRAVRVDKTAAPKVDEDPTRGKKPKGLAAVGFLRGQGTRSFRRRRRGGS